MEVQKDTNVIRLLIKAPDQKIDDKIIECQRDWTVARLKIHLEQVYPGKPKTSEQKIIFSGQLLNDSVILKDVVQQHPVQTENTFIIHLVCSVPRYSTITPTTTSATATETTRPLITTEPPTTSHPSLINQQYPGSQLNNQQMAWMQQAYAHYLTQYMQIMSAQAIQWQNTIPYTQSANANINSDTQNIAGLNNSNIRNNVDDNEERNARGQENNDGAAGGVPVAPPNNNNVGEEREAGLHRDWLDIFDILARLVVLCSIVYFYSSPSRFLIVSFLGFAVYLIQGGFFRIQPMFLGENNNGAMENNNYQQNAAAAQQAGQEQRTETLPTTNNETPVQNDQRTNANRDNERPGAWTFAWTFFSSFFTSLIPEQPPVI